MEEQAVAAPGGPGPAVAAPGPPGPAAAPGAPPAPIGPPLHVPPNMAGKTYIFSRNGPPVCADCGERGHLPDACSTAYCAKCDLFGHAEGEQCEQACSTCGRLHERPPAEGGEPGPCQVEACSLCELWGHRNTECPRVQCQHCGCWGHAIRACYACRLCKQWGHATASCPLRARSWGGLPPGAPGPRALRLDAPPFTPTGGLMPGHGGWPMPPGPLLRSPSGGGLEGSPAGDAARIQRLLGRLSVLEHVAPPAEEAQRRARFSQALMALLPPGSPAVGMLGDEQRVSVLSRLPAADISAVLRQVRPHELLDLVFRTYVNATPGVVPEQAAAQQQQHQQQQQAAQHAPPAGAGEPAGSKDGAAHAYNLRAEAAAGGDYAAAAKAGLVGAPRVGGDAPGDQADQAIASAVKALESDAAAVVAAQLNCGVNGGPGAGVGAGEGSDQDEVPEAVDQLTGLLGLLEV